MGKKSYSLNELDFSEGHVSIEQNAVKHLKLKEFDWTPNQLSFLKDAISQDSKVLFLQGCAGTGKNLVATYVGIRLLMRGKIDKIIYIRTPVEATVRGNVGSLGYLPGKESEKMGVYTEPFWNKISELVGEEGREFLSQERLVEVRPTNYLRGVNLGSEHERVFVIIDESENLSEALFKLVLTRITEHCKLVFLGDQGQSDIEERWRFFERLCRLFDTENARDHGIFYHELNFEDIKRSEVIKFILKEWESLSLVAKSNYPPMFSRS